MWKYNYFGNKFFGNCDYWVVRFISIQFDSVAAIFILEYFVLRLCVCLCSVDNADIGGFGLHWARHEVFVKAVDQFCLLGACLLTIVLRMYGAVATTTNQIECE